MFLRPERFLLNFPWSDAVDVGFQSDHILTEFSSDMVANGEYLHVHVCVILYTWRPGCWKTRVGTFTKDIYVSAEIIASFLDRGSQTWTLSDKGLGALGCRGAERRPMSCCMCEPMRTAQSLWRWHTCGGYTAKMWVESLAYRQVLDTRTRASMNVRLRHLVNEQVKLKRNGRKKSSSSHLKMLRRCLCAVFESVRMVRVETSQGTCSWVGRCVIVLHMSHKFSYTCAWSVHISPSCCGVLFCQVVSCSQRRWPVGLHSCSTHLFFCDVG